MPSKPTLAAPPLREWAERIISFTLEILLSSFTDNKPLSRLCNKSGTSAKKN